MKVSGSGACPHPMGKEIDAGAAFRGYGFRPCSKPPPWRLDVDTWARPGGGPRRKEFATAFTARGNLEGENRAKGRRGAAFA